MGGHHNVISRGQQQQKIAITFLVLAWLFLSLRIWTRTYIIASFGWDDATMILAAMFFTVYCSVMLLLDSHGGGTHVTNMETLAVLTRYAVIGEATYIITVMILKISVGIFLARIVVRRSQLLAIYITVTASILSSLACLFFVLFRCGTNFNEYLARQIVEHCTSNTLDRFFAYTQASFAALTDCIFAALPIVILWNANMDMRSKVSIGLILSLAALGCICSFIRFRYVDGLTQIQDFFWNATNIAIWSTIEPGAGIIAGCLATLRPCLRLFLIKARPLQEYVANSTRFLWRPFWLATRPSAPRSNIRDCSDRHSLPHIDTSTTVHVEEERMSEKSSEKTRKAGTSDCISSQSGTETQWLSRQGSCNTDYDRQVHGGASGVV
ncbi:hypothetical protein GQ43DRAFT_234899 [Delitschia confertaspora ATCC 74209]|uniref:Rhodopsin domain-containing protein n=1 Tax=Delitschia confertaspora ATCC 74209 TaxID=1513339 RepID=A0A9P4MLA8_9PLEO|nr:hypothetical protein GQ43DRAFT_234899 [Delitschia confertaspora ATCC 74209]